MDSIHPLDNQQKNPSSNQQVEALAAVIAAYGLDAADLISAVQNLAAAKQAQQQHQQNKARASTKTRRAFTTMNMPSFTEGGTQQLKVLPTDLR